MKHDIVAGVRINYAPCRYGLSRLEFRGPPRLTEGPFVACLGSGATFGKHARHPFPSLLEPALGLPALNLGVLNLGLEAMASDPTLAALTHDAAATVLEVPGAAGLCNAFYRVHPRRNDRFLAPTKALRDLFPEIDFAQVAFVGHLLRTLRTACPDRFDLVREELQAEWSRRMALICGRVPGPVVLLMLVDPDGGPALVSEEMVAALGPISSARLSLSCGAAGGRSGPASGYPTPLDHERIAHRLARLLPPLIYA